MAKTAFRLSAFQASNNKTGGEAGLMLLLLGLAGGAAALLDLLAFDNFVVDKQVVDGSGRLGALGDPFLDGFSLEDGNLGAWVVGTDDVDGLAPRVAMAVLDDHAVGRLLLLADAGETDGKHAFEN